VVRSAAEAVEALQQCGAPVVVKPLDANQGKGVSLHVETPEQARAAFEEAVRYAPRAIVEQMAHGRDYRVLVVNNRVVG
jgi:cyanophycin synthetase